MLGLFNKKNNKTSVEVEETESRLSRQLAKALMLLEMLDNEEMLASEAGLARQGILNQVKAICQKEPALVRFTEGEGHRLIDVFLEKQSYFIAPEEQVKYQNLLAFLLGSMVNPETAEAFSEGRLNFIEFCLTVLPAFEIYPHLLEAKVVINMFEAKRSLHISLKEYAAMLDGLGKLWPHLRDNAEIKKLMTDMRPPDLNAALRDLYAEGHRSFHSREAAALRRAIESYKSPDLADAAAEGPPV